MHTLTHTCTHTLIHTCTHSHIHTRTHMHTHMHAHTHMHTRTHTLSHTNTHARMQTHTHHRHRLIDGNMEALREEGTPALPSPQPVGRLAGSDVDRSIFLGLAVPVRRGAAARVMSTALFNATTHLRPQREHVHATEGKLRPRGRVARAGHAMRCGRAVCGPGRRAAGLRRRGTALWV